MIRWLDRTTKNLEPVSVLGKFGGSEVMYKKVTKTERVLQLQDANGDWVDVELATETLDTSALQNVA